MAEAVSGSCRISLGMFRGACDRPAVARCVYCGRPFCAEHGERGADHADSCSRRRCRAKRKDIAAHLEWKRRVSDSNRAAVCAHEGCGNRARRQCSRCDLLFCEQHVKDLRVAQSGVGGRDQRASLCEHCSGRLKLWR